MSSSNNKPRPIHTIHRGDLNLRVTPDENEPSFSYEQESFMVQAEDDVEDEFHRRLASNSRRESSTSSSHTSGTTTNAGGGGPAGSFWRTDTPNWQQQAAGPAFSNAQMNHHHHNKGGDATVTVNERRTSGGLLGAALQLHSQTESPEPVATMWKNGDATQDGGDSSSARFNKRDSSTSQHSNSSRGDKKGDKKKDASKQRLEARHRKLDAQLDEVDIGHIMEVVDLGGAAAALKNHNSANNNNSSSLPFSPSEEQHQHQHQHPPLVDGHSHGSTASSDATSSSGTTGVGLLYGKSPSHHQPRNNSGVLFGKSSSLIFPTGVEPPADPKGESSNIKRHKINLLLDQCETVRFPFKKKLMLNNLHLTAADIPVKDLYGTSLGNSLHKLSLAGNRLATVPPKLVSCLVVLKTLDLSQCELHQLPETWNLPQLKRLNLSHNRLTEFPEETMLEGLLDLQDLNMYGNKVAVIVVPHNPKLLSKLETLNLGYNDLAYVPEDLDRLKALRNFKVMNNFLEKVPMRVCDMDLKTIDVSSNPVIQPPIETCERGICSMKRYYHCLRVEEQSKDKAQEALQVKALRHKRNSATKKAVMEKVMGLVPKPKFILGARKLSEETNVSNSSSLHMSDNHLATTKKPTSIAETGSTILPAAEPQPSSSVSMLPAPQSATSPLTPQKSAVATGSLSSSTSPSSALIGETEVKKSVATSERDSIASDNRDSISNSDIIDNNSPPDQVTVNDTLKVIFVGMAMAGKTSMIKRLMEGEDAVIPKRDERTVGVDIYEWDPKEDKRFEHIDSRIQLQDKELEETCGDVNVKFSVWDFAGQHVYHATHELFFSQRALYVLVWDMGATNSATMKRKNSRDNERGAFKLSYDSSDDESDDDAFTSEEEARRADRALERDIDEKVQFWVDCIQSSAPGAAILPVASFDDLFSDNSNEEAKRRCNIMKQRLLRHEERRIKGIKDRLQEYCDKNRANDEGALRLRKLLCSYTRPKLIFGNDEEDSVVRVSGTKYTGFATLTERIINLATGRDKGQWRYPIFRGHVGARIPRMRLEVRMAVRTLRDRFKVVEWGYFINQLRDRGLMSVEDISDALHFLTNIGELSYFGGVLPDRESSMSPIDDSNPPSVRDSKRSSGSGDDDNSVMSDDEDFDFDDNAFLSIDNTSITVPSTEDSGSLTTMDDSYSTGLSQFVFLNPRWLVAAVACILRHDLDREIQETRRAIAAGGAHLCRGESFYEANLNCPVITADDACMLWQAKKFTKKAAERAEEYSNEMTLKPFAFLQLLLTRFGVFVPIDLGIDSAFLGGKEYAMGDKTPTEISVDPNPEAADLKAMYFFLPSLLGPGEPAEAWTYKCTDSWKTTLCHSVLFPDGVPPGLMERVTAGVLSNIYAIANRQESPLTEGIDGKTVATYEGQITVKEVLCWRTAFFVKLGMQVVSSNGENKESIVEVFSALVDRDSHLCVGSDYLGVGMRRLITCGKGQVGDGGRKIWKGGYLLVCKAIQRIMDEYGGLEYEKQGFCPECLAKKAVSEASAWDFTVIRAAVRNGEDTMRCRHGHRVDTRLVAGPVDNLQQTKTEVQGTINALSGSDPIVPVNDLLRGVVVVGLWDGKSRNVVRVGSGFIADRKRGLIVTASHTLMNIWGDKNTQFGENYYGLRQGKVVIGVIARKKGEEAGTMAVFRYFAKIVAKDPSIDQGECHLDACILRITTRMEHDVGGSGEGCGDEPERLLLNNPHALKQEKLHQLKITEKCELDEQVRIIGYNQGGEGLLGPGERLNRYVDFARGYVCKKFTGGEGGDGYLRHRFKPREEIVVICPTIGGHSGGPCVNQQGEVIGILSRADPAENQRCYLVPTYEWKSLLRQAKNTL